MDNRVFDGLRFLSLIRWRGCKMKVYGHGGLYSFDQVRWRIFIIIFYR